MPAGPSGDPRGTRLRDLDPRQRLLAAVLGLLLVVPVAVSAGRAIADDWVPSGDEAVIAVRVHDVLSTDPPLTGLPSTSDLYGTGIATRHPGPIEFYLLALPVKLLGPQLGLLLGAGAFTAASMLIAAWVALRRAGPGVALGVAVLLVITTWSTGTAVLTDPISSNVGGWPLLAAAVLAWALLRGDLRLVPLAVAVVSFAAQQHLAMVIPSAALAAVGAVGTGVALRGAWPDRERRRAALRWIGLGVVVGAVLWLPVAIDQVTGHPGNITAVLRFSGDGARGTLGTSAAVHAVLRAGGAPPLLVHNDLTGSHLTAPLDGLRVAASVLVLLATLVLAVGAWRRRPDLASLGVVAVVLAAAGFVATESVPDSFEAGRINLYRWTFALAFVVWWAIGSMVVGAVLRWRPAVRVAPFVAVATAVVVLVASLATTGPDDERRDADAFALDRRLGDVVSHAYAGAGPVVVVDDGTAANLSVAPALIARLVDDGVHVQLPRERADAYGDERVFDPTTARSALLVVSRFGGLGPQLGRRLGEVRLSPRSAAVVDRLVTAARSGPVRRSAEAAAMRARVLPALGDLADRAIEHMATSPYEVLASPYVLGLLLDGYLDSPRFDRADLEEMRRLLPQQRSLWTDDRVAVYRLTIPQLRAARPELFAGR